MALKLFFLLVFYLESIHSYVIIVAAMAPENSYFMVDVEADGPVPSLYSMVSIGAVFIEIANSLKIQY